MRPGCCTEDRRARHGNVAARSRRFAVLVLLMASAALAGCVRQPDDPVEDASPAAEGPCAIEGFSLGMPIREAVDRVNRGYLASFGPPRYKTAHRETQQWMESLAVKPIRVDREGPRTREYVYDRFHVVRYRDDGREYMFPFSPFMTDDEGRVISIFLVGPIAQKLYSARTMDQTLYLEMLGRKLGVRAWKKVEPPGGEVYWTAAFPGQCTFEVYEDKGVKLLPAATAR